jgi:hypothetical protein
VVICRQLGRSFSEECARSNGTATSVQVVFQNVRHLQVLGTHATLQLRGGVTPCEMEQPVHRLGEHEDDATRFIVLGGRSSQRTVVCGVATSGRSLRTQRYLSLSSWAEALWWRGNKRPSEEAVNRDGLRATGRRKLLTSVPHEGTRDMAVGAGGGSDCPGRWTRALQSVRLPDPYARVRSGTGSCRFQVAGAGVT